MIRERGRENEGREREGEREGREREGDRGREREEGGERKGERERERERKGERESMSALRPHLQSPHPPPPLPPSLPGSAGSGVPREHDQDRRLHLGGVWQPHCWRPTVWVGLVEAQS